MILELGRVGWRVLRRGCSPRLSLAFRLAHRHGAPLLMLAEVTAQQQIIAARGDGPCADRVDKRITALASAGRHLLLVAEAMAATYDGSPESLDRLMRVLNTTDADDLAYDLSVSASDLAAVDEVARRRLAVEQARAIPEAGTTGRQAPGYGW